MTNKEKLTSWDVDFYNSLSDEIRAICVTEKERYVIGQALRQVAWSTRWHGDTSAMNLDGIAADIEYALSGLNCDGHSADVQCFRVTPENKAFTFYPNHPITNPKNDGNAPIVAQTRWETVGRNVIRDIPLVGDYIANVTSDIIGYFPNDAILLIDAYDLIQNPLERIADIIETVTSFWFPYVTFTVEGAAEVDIELVKMPFGCSVIIVPDISQTLSELASSVLEFIDNDGELPQTWIISELDRDLIAAPPELGTIEVQTVRFEEEGLHTVHVCFPPRLNDGLPFVNPFGGIRAVQICGGNLINQDTGEPITPDNYGDEFNIQEGIISMATVQDVCDGVMCAIEKTAQRIISAQSGNILSGVSIAPDGTIQVDSSAIGVIGSVYEQRNGGTYSVSLRLHEAFANIQDWICVSAIGTADTKRNFKALYQVADETLADTFIDNVVTYLGACGGAIWYEELEDEFSEALYCKGVSKSSLSLAVIEYGTDSSKMDLMLEAISVIAESQLTSWYNAGVLVPIDAYQGYGCYIRPEQSIVYTPAHYDNNTSVSLTVSGWTFAKTRALRITMSGNLIDANDTDKTLDFLYYKNDAASNPTYTSSYFVYFRVENSGQTLRPAIAPAFNENGDYEYTIILPPQTVASFHFYRQAATKILTSPVTGGITFTVQDLGEV